jgi:predicted ATPase
MNDLLNYLLGTKLGRTCLFVGFCNSKPASSENSNIDTNLELRIMFQSSNIVIVEIPPLNLEEVKMFLNDIFRPSINDVTPLASILLNRSKGNYTYLKEIIKCCEKKEIIRFNNVYLSWTWNLKEFEAEFKITEDSVGLMLRQMEEIDSKTKQVLKIAGNLLLMKRV